MEFSCEYITNRPISRKISYLHLPYRRYTSRRLVTSKEDLSQNGYVDITLSDEEKEDKVKRARVPLLSKGIKYYRDGLGLESAVPEFIGLVAGMLQKRVPQIARKVMFRTL